MIINTKEPDWLEFRIGDIFKVSGTKTTHPRELIIDGNTPRITCASTDNALDNFYKNQASEKGGLLTVDSATDGYVFYQGYDFIATDHVETISLKNNKFMSKELGLFLVNTINNFKNGKYYYGYKFSQTRIRNQIIKLPVDKYNKPDWNYMESEGKRIVDSKKNELIKYLNKKIDSIYNILPKEISPLENKSWDIFIQEDLFKLGNGRATKLQEFPKGNISYIGATNRNNGVMGFVDIHENDKRLVTGNALVFICNGDGSIGYSVYKHEPFVASVDVKYGHSEKLNRYTGLFISTISDRMRGKYNFGYKRNKTRLANERLLLPTTPDGSPDWEFMEHYMQQLELKKLKQLRNHYLYK